MDYLKEKKTNILYNLYTYKLSNIKIDKETTLYLLGEKLEIKNYEKKQICDIFNKIPWFSYRKGFKSIQYSNNKI